MRKILRSAARIGAILFLVIIFSFIYLHSHKGVLFIPRGVLAQGIFELSCTAGTSPVQSMNTTDNVTGKGRMNFCVDNAGNMIFQGAGGTTIIPPGIGTISPLSFGAKSDVLYFYNCTITSGSQDITCPNASFTSANVNALEFGTSYNCNAVNVNCISPGSGMVLAAPLGTILSINSPTSVHVSIAATVNCTPSVSNACGFAYGTQDDTVFLNNAGNAAWNNGSHCFTVDLTGSGASFFSAAIFISATGNACGEGTTSGFGGDLNSQGPELRGQGRLASMLIPLPTFDFTTCIGGSGQACIFGVGNGQAHDFSVNGLGQSLPSTTHAVNIFELAGANGANCSGGMTGWNLGFAGWALQSTSSVGFRFTANGCNNPMISNINVEMFGATPCSLGSVSNEIDAFALFCFGSTGPIAQMGGSAVINTYGSQFMGNLVNGQGDIVCTGGAGNSWNSFGDLINTEFAVGGSGNTDMICSNGAFMNAYFYGTTFVLPNQPSAAQVFFLNGNNVNIHLRGTKITATGANNRILNIVSASNNVFDECGNTFNQGTLANIGTAIFGSCSTTGNVLATGNVSITACGTSAASAFSGTSAKGQFTITFAGAPGASCTATVTFPTVFPFIAPICTWTDVGGTNAFPTSIVNGAVSTTSTAMTETATAFTNGNTEILQYACAVP